MHVQIIFALRATARARLTVRCALFARLRKRENKNDAISRGRIISMQTRELIPTRRDMSAGKCDVHKSVYTCVYMCAGAKILVIKTGSVRKIQSYVKKGKSQEKEGEKEAKNIVTSRRIAVEIALAGNRKNTAAHRGTD